MTACDETSCVAVWTEGQAVHSLAFAPDGSVQTPRVVSPAPRRSAFVRVAALQVHAQGFAYLETTASTLDRARLDLVVLSRAGEFRQRTRVAAYYGNGSDPAMLVHGSTTLVAYSRTERAVAVVEITGGRRGRPVTLPGPHVTNPSIAHDGTEFVLMWLAWSPSGPSVAVAPLSHRAEPEFVLERTSFACAHEACILLGERDGNVVEEGFRNGRYRLRQTLVPNAGANAALHVPSDAHVPELADPACALDQHTACRILGEEVHDLVPLIVAKNLPCPCEVGRRLRDDVQRPRHT